MPLTAAQARSQAEQIRNNSDELFAKSWLGSIYQKIEDATLRGQFSIQIECSLRVNKEYIKGILNKDGYTVGFTFQESYRECAEYIRISW